VSKHVPKEIGIFPTEDMEELPSTPIQVRNTSTKGMLQMSMYNMPYQRASTYELVAYKDRGTPQPTKHTKAIHEKYCQLIDQHVRKGTEYGTNMKTPKVPEPKAYDSEEDAKIFEG